jgi:hypothetical protein
MRINHALLWFAFCGQALNLIAQVHASRPQAADRLVAGCRGGRSGGGRGLVITSRGEVLEWQQDGPGVPDLDDDTRVGTDSAAAAALFAELAWIRFESIVYQKQACFLELVAVAWPLGESPVQLDELRMVLQRSGQWSRTVSAEWPGQVEAAPHSLACGRGRMRSEDAAACDASFDRFMRRFLLFGWGLTVPVLLVASRRTAIFQLAELYPPVPVLPRHRCVFAGAMVVGKLSYRACAWLRVDDAYLHVSGFGPARLWVPRLSIALSDITATRETLRWGLYNRLTIRLTLGRDPSVRFLVRPDDFEKLAAASGGGLRLADPTPVAIHLRGPRQSRLPS